MKKYLSKIVCLLMAFFFFGKISAQDIHFSQPQFSPLNISPAFAGVFKEDIRMMGSYRSQWQSVPVPYLTFSGAADMKLQNLLRRSERLSLAGGIHFNYDKAGDSELSLSSFGVTGALHYQINDFNTIVIGAQSTLAQRAFSIEGLRFNQQFDGDVYSSSNATGENFSNENKAFVDLSAGISWWLQKEDSRSQALFGAGFFHLNRPNQSFNNDTNSKLPMRISLQSLGIIQIHPKWDVIIKAVSQLQYPYTELLVGTGGRYHLSQKRGKELALQFSTNYRIEDAVIPSFEVHYAAWQFGLSYDINISKFETATNGRGGIELGIIYTITKVKPIDIFESCPVF